MRKLLLAAFFLLSSLGLHAQTVPVTGNLKTVLGESLGSNTFVRFRLRNYKPNRPLVSGVGIIGQTTKDVAPDSNGLINTTVYDNDFITPDGTFYTLEFYLQGRFVFAASYTITGASFDFNTAIPLSSVPMAAVPVAESRVFTHIQATPATTWIITHNFAVREVTLDFYDGSFNRIFPDLVTLTDINTVTALFVVAQSGRAVVMRAENVNLTSSISDPVLKVPLTAQSISGGFDLTLDGNFLLSTTGQDICSDSVRCDIFFRNLGTSYYNVKGYGAVGDGVADETAAIQAAIDAADAAIVASVRESVAGIPVVFFPTGEYRITAVIDPKRVHLMGVFPSNSSRIMWDGAAGATAFTFTSSVSFRLISGLSFIDFDNTDLPATWFLFSGVGPDQMLVMERLQFISSSSDAIKFASGWVNLHMHKMRWDGIGGWAINSLAGSTQNNSSWSLDDFTYALNDSTLAGDPPGVFRFENPDGSTFVGIAQISNAKVEISGSVIDLSGNKAIVEFDGNATAGASWMSVEFSNIAVQVGAGITGTTLFHSGNSSGGNGTIPFVIENSKIGTANLITGEWNTWTLPFTSGALIHHFNFNSHSTTSPFTFASKPIEAIGFSSSVGVFEARQRADTGYRLQVTSDGDFNWGPGDGTTDLVLDRGGAGGLRFLTGSNFSPAVAGKTLGVNGFEWLLNATTVNIDDTLNHDGTNAGFFGVAPATQPGVTDEIKAALSSLGLLQDGSATPLDLDGGLLTAGGVVSTAGVIEYTDAPTLAASTTPSVTGGNVFLTNSTASITDFTGEQNGQVITLLCEADTTTSLVDSTPLFLSAAFTCTADDTITLVSNGTVWYETSRSVN